MIVFAAWSLIRRRVVRLLVVQCAVDTNELQYTVVHTITVNKLGTVGTRDRYREDDDWSASQLVSKCSGPTVFSRIQNVHVQNRK